MSFSPALAAALADRYELVRELGAGGMATVYLARDVRHARVVAIKVLHPELAAVLGAERFLSEIRTTASLQHPHILPLFDSGEAAGQLFYVMPFVDGETLRTRLEREKQLPIADALLIAREVADALQYAHERGVIHRDIKPENILLQGGHALVADFGIALAVTNAGGTRMTQTGLSLGTPQYMAPEQAMGERTIDARADVYALGAVTYEMLAGEAPFTGPTSQAIVAKILTGRPVAPSAMRDTVPAHVEQAVLAALEKHPADRLADARAFADALNGARSVPVAARATAAPLANRPARAWPLVAGVLALTTIAVGAFAWRASRERPPGPMRVFEVQLPDSVDVAPIGGNRTVLSRDGSRLVVVVSVGNRTELWTRERGSTEITPITAASGLRLEAPVGVNPALSSDGQWIAMHDGVGIVAARVGGSTRRIIADTGSMPAISDRGAVVYANTGQRALLVVPLEGGTPRVVARADTAQGQYSLIWPEALPGGTHALVTVNHYLNGRLLDSMRLALVDLESGTLRELGVTGHSARALRNGWVLFGQPGNRLVAAPFSVRDARFTAEPVQLLDDVGQGSGGAIAFSVADDGTLIHAKQGQSAGGRIIRRSLDGRRTDTLTASSNLRFPRVSPDGRWLVATNGSNVNDGVSLVELSTGTQEQLVAPGEGGRAEWLPDSRRVVFLRSAGPELDLVARRIDRSGADSLLASLDGARGVTAIEPGPLDGWAALVGGSAGGGTLFRAPMRNLDELSPLIPSRGRQRKPAVSTDGRAVAYEDDESGATKVYMVPLPGPGPRLTVSIGEGQEPRWSPNGQAVLYRTSVGVERATLDASRTRVVSRDTLRTDAFFDRSSLSLSTWDVHPDGSIIFSSLPRAVPRLFVHPEWRALLARKTP